MDKAIIEQAVGKAKALVASLEAYDGTAIQQLALLKEVDAVRATMEQPYDTAMRWVEGMTPFASLNILNRVGVYAHFPEAVGATVSASELAAACRCDVSIITRAIRLAIYNGVFVETAPDVYAHNDLSRAFGPVGLGGFFGVGSDLMKAWLCLPEYVQAHQPEDLYDVRKTPAAFAEGHEGKTYYEIQALNPERRLLWNLTMQSMEKNFPILGMFPFRDLVPAAKNQQDGQPILVDVGGGRGQALLKIREDCGDAFDGKMILQDLPVVVDSLKAEELPGIQPMKYDIFTPQPIKNARVYFMRRLLHDFYDPDVKSILRNTASAMGPESRLVVSDMLLPEKVQLDGPSTSYWLDLSLLAIGGKERNMANFVEIFDDVGLELVKVYRSEGTDIAMLETRLKRIAE